MSVMQTMTLHFMCSLHVKWNVRDHVCGTRGSFGKVAAEIWSKLMQNADGPRAFESGFRRMLLKYVDDPERTEYIRELHDDENKAHFKRNLEFSNGVLVDVCECLFSALKTWIGGRTRTCSSLLMAIVCIVEGCRMMILKSYLKDVRFTRKKFIQSNDPSQVIYLFNYFIGKLTHKAIKMMYDGLVKSLVDYTLEVDPGNSLLR